MKNRKKWLIGLALVLVVLTAALMVWARQAEQSWTVYSFTSTNTITVHPTTSGNYNWSVVFHGGTPIDFIIVPSGGSAVVWLDNCNSNQSGTVHLNQGVSYTIATDEGSQSIPGGATCNVNDYQDQGDRPGNP
jgi:hypothetical protein